MDIVLDTDFRFFPKKTRPLIGKLIKRGRAEFRTAFADDLKTPGLDAWCWSAIVFGSLVLLVWIVTVVAVVAAKRGWW